MEIHASFWVAKVAYFPKKQTGQPNMHCANVSFVWKAVLIETFVRFSNFFVASSTDMFLMICHVVFFFLVSLPVFYWADMILFQRMQHVSSPRLLLH